MDVGTAAKLLSAGETVVFPTETVYGLGADAANPAAVGKIFALKGRPANHPLIVHVAGTHGLRDWGSDVPNTAIVLAEKFWPGPLTIIVKRSNRVPLIVTGGQESVGLRCPSHPMAQELLREFERIGSGAVAAPSANKFGHVSPTTAQHVRDEFGSNIPILDGGACEVGLESTIVDLSRGAPVLLRPGAITRKQIAKAIGEEPRDRDEHSPRASGTLAAHYAPRTSLTLMSPASLDMDVRSFANVAVLARREPSMGSKAIFWIVASDDPARYAHDLYANLRKLDDAGAKRILVEAPPPTPEWEAVNDRLARAAAGSAMIEDEP
jgi:L-threonylcarbamoyladenylate synthase